MLNNNYCNNVDNNYHKLFSDRVKPKIVEADLICDHMFDLLGSGLKKVSSRNSLSPENERLRLRFKHISDLQYGSIDWHYDFKSGYRWNPKSLSSTIQVYPGNKVDLKIPWELSRFQHLPVLGQAYLLTRKTKYSDEFATQVYDWIINNPVGFGINWICTMDVAIRAANWLVAMEFFTDDNLFPEEFTSKFYASLIEHGRFIQSHLEYAGKWTTNHYLADIAGLFFISVYCPFFKESNKWREFAYSELHKEIDKQVNPDGCSFEASTSYHRFVLEMFFYPVLLGRMAGIEFSERYNEKLKKMFDFSLYCIKPDGMIPQIGDNDSARFLRFSKKHVLDHKYLLSLAAIYFGDSGFKLKQLDLDEEAFCVFGENAKTIWDSLPFREDLPGSKSFPDTGWYIMRHKNDYCIISCGPNGGDGWHSHNDKLSFELVIDGHDVIVDPGTYVYTSYPEERNKFRSTGYHNTIKFEGVEQNDISEEMFLLRDRVKIINAKLKETDNKMIKFAGEIHYKGIKHMREIMFDKKINEWQIKDSITCPSTMNAKLLFHLAPDITYDDGSLLNKINNEKLASIEVHGYELTKDKYEYSPEYGVKIEAECLKVHLFADNRERIINTYITKL